MITQLVVRIQERAGVQGVRVAVGGPPGPPGPSGPPGGGGATAYVHNQASASFVWTINHNLGYRPAVELFDSGSQEFDAQVSHPTVNQTVVTMSVATSGFARLL